MLRLLLLGALVAVPLAAASNHREAVPLRPTDAVVADLDRDRDIDVAVVGRCRGKQTVCLTGVENENRKLGTVRNVELRGVAIPSPSVAATKTGLVIAGNAPSGPDVVVLTSRGNGAFAFTQQFPLPGGALDVAVGDVNGDGRADIVTAGPGGLAVFPGGAAGFGDPTRVTTPFRPVALTVERLDGDAFADIAFVGGKGVAVIEGNRELTFAAADIDVDVLRATARDIDGVRVAPDATPDIAVATASGVQLFATQPGADGVLDLTGGPFLGGTQPVGVVLADVTRDNLVDVVALNAGSGNVSTNVASAGGGYGAPIRSVPVGANPVSLAVADFNNDGMPDVVVANAPGAGSGAVSVLTGHGSGAFTTGASPPPTSVGAVPVTASLTWGHPTPNEGFSWLCTTMTAASGARLTLTLTLPDSRTIAGTLQLKRKPTRTARGTFNFRITELGRYELEIVARAPNGKVSRAKKELTVTSAQGSATCGG